MLKLGELGIDGTFVVVVAQLKLTYSLLNSKDVHVGDGASRPERGKLFLMRVASIKRICMEKITNI